MKIISSDTMKLDEVELFIREFFEKYQISERLFFEVMLCVKEAVTNSIIHGNQLDKCKEVYIEISKCNQYLYFKIKDEGEGFNFTKLNDPTCEELIRNESGRGIFLIKHFSDNILFRDKGNVIEFKISLNGTR